MKISLLLVQEYFNPRSPRGERLKPIVMLYICTQFQSTLPSRGATIIPAEMKEVD